MLAEAQRWKLFCFGKMHFCEVLFMIGKLSVEPGAKIWVEYQWSAGAAAGIKVAFKKETAGKYFLSDWKCIYLLFLAAAKELNKLRYSTFISNSATCSMKAVQSHLSPNQNKKSDCWSMACEHTILPAAYCYVMTYYAMNAAGKVQYILNCGSVSWIMW